MPASKTAPSNLLLQAVEPSCGRRFIVACGRLAVVLVSLGMVPLQAQAGEHHGFTPSTAADAVRELAPKIGMPADRQAVLLERLSKSMPEVIAQHEDASVDAIFVYQIGEGGLLVKVRKGKGVVRFYGAKNERNLRFKSVTVGAQIGGSSEWGVGLVLGLKRPEFFGGDYKGSSKGATAVEASINTSELSKSKTKDLTMLHRIVMIGTAAGLSANAAFDTLKIIVDR